MAGQCTLYSLAATHPSPPPLGLSTPMKSGTARTSTKTLLSLDFCYRNRERRSWWSLRSIKTLIEFVRDGREGGRFYIPPSAHKSKASSTRPRIKRDEEFQNPRSRWLYATKVHSMCAPLCAPRTVSFKPWQKWSHCNQKNSKKCVGLIVR